MLMQNDTTAQSWYIHHREFDFKIRANEIVLYKWIQMPIPLEVPGVQSSNDLVLKSIKFELYTNSSDIWVCSCSLSNPVALCTNRNVNYLTSLDCKPCDRYD